MNAFMVVFIAYLAFLLIFGAIAARRNKKQDSQEFFVAGRSMSRWIVAGTYGASFLSAGTFMGTTGLNYLTGFAPGWQSIAPYTCLFVLAVFFAKKIWRFGYNNNACTMPDVIAMRYPSKFGRIFYSVMILCIYTVGMASMYMGLNTIFSMVSDIPYLAGIVVCAIIVIIFVFSGGARSVAWTDTVCMVLMVIAMVGTTIAALLDVGGLGELAKQLSQVGIPEGADPRTQGGEDLVNAVNGYYTIPMTIGWFLTWTFGNMCQPHQFTRIYLARNEKESIAAVAICMIPFALICIGGIIVGAYARITHEALPNIDQAFPTVVLDIFPAAFAAVILVGIISAIISTASTMLLITSQCTSFDIYKKVINPNADDKTVLKISRATIVICGCLSIVVAYFARDIAGLIFLWSSAFAMMGAGILPSLIGAFWYPRATTAANIASMIVGFGSTALMYLVPSLLPTWAPHPILPGLILSFLVFFIVTYVTPKPSKEQLEPFFGEKMKDYSKRNLQKPAE